MNDGRKPCTGDTGEDATALLLRLAGARPAVPDDRTARVRSAVHVHWRARNRRRAIQRRLLSSLVFVAAAAAVILVIGRRSRNDQPVTRSGELVAIVEQVHGTPQHVSSAGDGVAPAGLSRNDPIRSGDWISTDARARVGLRFNDGTSVRLDAGTRARPLSSSAIELGAGAVYVDSERASGGFEVRTALATARDIGTQFEVRLLDRAVRLRVRTGIVELMSRDRLISGRQGTEIVWTGSAAVSRPIDAYGPEWEWTTRVAPPLDIEGMRLSEFLDRVAREQGWKVRYADSALASEASSITLHGSVDTLSPRDAIDVAIATSRLRHRLEGGDLVLYRK